MIERHISRQPREEVSPALVKAVLAAGAAVLKSDNAVEVAKRFDRLQWR